MAKDAIKMSGKITKVFSTKDYEVLLENNIIIKAFTSGKMTLHNIKMIPGDVVDVLMIWLREELFLDINKRGEYES